jgi:glycosyltransferase involved in cell wall biosynthesis
MKILQVISSFPPAYSYGGAPKVAYEISKELIKKGHEVTVFTTDVYDINSRLKFDKNPVWIDGIEVYHFKNISNNLAYKNYSIAPMMVSKMAEKIKDFDLIHLHEYRSTQAMFVHHYAKRFSVPYILQAHGAVLPIFQKQKLKNIFDFFFGFNLLNDASKLIALTKTEAEEYKKMGVSENNIEIVPNGINISEYEKLPDRGIFRNRYGIKTDDKVVLYLGRIHKSKGIDLLVDAFSELSTQLTNVYLLLVGPDDGYKQSLIERTNKLGTSKILFPGFVTFDEKIAVFRDADVFVTPSFSGFPVTFLEACACGVPIITTNKGDKLDWINGNVGYVVDYDRNQLSETIYKILSDKGLKSKFSKRGKQMVTEQFEWNNIVLKFEQIYLDSKL